MPCRQTTLFQDSAGVFIQIALGVVYAWSVFQTPFTRQFGWNILEVTLTAKKAAKPTAKMAMVNGLWLDRSSPRVIAITGGALYGPGVFLASFSAGKLWWLYLSNGVIRGIGLASATSCPSPSS